VNEQLSCCKLVHQILFYIRPAEGRLTLYFMHSDAHRQDMNFDLLFFNKNYSVVIEIISAAS